jgi:hypothetical protein
MAKPKKKKAVSKPRPDKYEGKYAVEGSFLDVFKVVKKNKEDKKKND